MWCNECKRKVYDVVCEVCGNKTQEDIPIEIYWCDKCKVPIIKEVCDLGKETCPICGSDTKYLAKDIRPVFPEEKKVIEILIGKNDIWKGKTIWANNSRYYIDGKSKAISFKKLDSDLERVSFFLETYNSDNDYKEFNETIKLFIEANKDRLNYIKSESINFIQQETSRFLGEHKVISFSGGKDSTVVADLVIRALSNPSIVHIFGDTTLEFDTTYEYVKRYRRDNPQAIFRIAKNKEQDFYNVCDDIGPPARMLRWCCTMFKTGPITRVINSIFKDSKILTFYGVRKNESVSRSKYNRVENDSSQVKILKQIVASPIFYWCNADVWLYILGENIDFNDAYRLGFDRVGCWCCPNNSKRSEILSKIFMPIRSEKWYNYLVGFAEKVGKPDAEEYVSGGWWKARQGGNGLSAAEDVKLKFSNCTAEDNAQIYSLNKQIDENFYNLLIPFGKVSKELGRKLINEVLVLDINTNVPIISVQPFSQEGYEYSVKVKTMNVKSHKDLQRQIGYQVRKFNSCRQCLKCESICKYNAISITNGKYRIDENKCKRCRLCVSQKILTGGCMMDKYLKVRKDN